ncbi:MAG: hypothetical protein ABR884_00235 [Minisyncoccia bacterium]|jgi:hypothetical protein
MKRYLYIIIGIIVAAAIVILVLFLIKNNAASTTITTSGTTGGSLPAAGTQGSGGSGVTSSVATLGLSPIASGTSANTNNQTVVQNFGVLSQSPALDYFVDAQNNITAIQPTGAIITIKNGQTTTVNSSTIDGIISASFSYDGKKIVVNYGDPSDPRAGVYDVATNAWTALPQGILSPQWSPANNYQIAYLAVPSAGKLTLATVNAANLKTTPTTLLTLNANDLALQWPTASEFILSDKPTSQNAGSVWVYNSSAGTLEPLIYEVPGAEGIWSHNAAIPYGLTFFNNPSGQGGNTLQLQVFSGNLPTQPLVFSTLPSKCAFNTELMPVATSTAGAATSTTASSTAKISAKVAATSTPYLALYCGIPRSSSGFSSAHLPDAYNTMALFTSDDIYKINTATGAEQVLWSDATQNMDVSDVKFFNDALFFVNRYDQKLYGLTFSN